MARIEFTKEMAEALRDARLAKGLSQYDLATQLDRPRASVKRWECFEVQTIDSKVFAKIEKILGPLDQKKSKPDTQEAQDVTSEPETSATKSVRKKPEVKKEPEVPAEPPPLSEASLGVPSQPEPPPSQPDPPARPESSQLLPRPAMSGGLRMYQSQGLTKRTSTLVYHRVTLDRDTPVASLRGIVKIVDRGLEVVGFVSGVECTSKQSREGIKAGETVVLAIRPERKGGL